MKGWKQTGGDLLVYEGKTTILEVKVKTKYMNFRDLLVLLWAQWVPPLLDHHVHPSEQDIRQDNHQSSKRQEFLSSTHSKSYLTNPLVGTFNPVRYSSLMCFYMRLLRLLRNNLMNLMHLALLQTYLFPWRPHQTNNSWIACVTLVTQRDKQNIIGSSYCGTPVFLQT